MYLSLCDSEYYNNGQFYSRSGLLRVMETLFYAPSLVLGFSGQKQELQVDFFSRFETDPHTPGEVLTVEIQSRHIQVKEATMEIVAELRGGFCHNSIL